MRILMTTDSVGGVWDLSLRLGAGLQTLGHDVVLAHAGPQPSALQQDQAQQADLPLLVGGFPLEWMPAGLERADACRQWLRQAARQTEADVVHCNSYSHVDADSPVPQVLVAHSSLHGWWEATHADDAPPEWRPYMAVVQHALQVAHAVVAPTHAMLDELVRCYGPTQGTVIHNGLPMPADVSSTREDVVLTGGRLWDEGKGHKVLDAAAAGLDWPVQATGSRRGPDAMVEFEHVKCLGFLSRDELESAYASAAIYANPAIYEPFGLGVLEAASHGCALIVSDLPSQRELWGDAAIYAPPGDAAAWHDTLSRLIREPSRRQHLARAARQRALRFDVNTMATHYERLYEQLQVVA